MNYYKNIYVLDNNEDKLNPFVRLLYKDLMGGFTRCEFKINYNASKEDVTDKSLIFMDNNVKKETIEFFISNVKDSLYFGWCCHETKLKNHNFEKINFFYITCFTKTPSGEQKKLVQNTKNYVPLYHRANENPENIGKHIRNIKYDWCYIGAPYRTDLIPKSNKFTNYQMASFNVKNYLSSEKRKEIYLSSLIHLAYQGDTNIKDGHVSQRVFEGLTYGCIVLSNSKPACEQTNNIVEYVKNIEDVEEKIEFYKRHPEEILKKQNDAYNLMKEMGTNDFSINKFNEKSKEVYNIDFMNNKKLSFIILRYVDSEKTNIYWNLCIDSISKYYPNSKIIVIDDHSTYKPNRIGDDIDSEFEVINSHLECSRGEFLPYYYIHNMNLQGNYIILHDTVIVNKDVDLELKDSENVKFLWTTTDAQGNNEMNDIISFFKLINYSDELINFYRKIKKSGFKMCFGGMSIINSNYLKTIFEYYNCSESLNAFIDSRYKRTLFERIIAILFYHYSNINNVMIVNGDIIKYKMNNRHVNIENYKKSKENMIKIFLSRENKLQKN